MVLVRFPHDLLLQYSKLGEKEILEVPWRLGGESRLEGEEVIMEFNPDRPDLYSIQGVTRAMRIFTGKESFEVASLGQTNYAVNSTPPRIRPFFLAGIVKNVNVKQLLAEIIDFQEKLHKTIGRDRRLSAIGIHDLTKINFPLCYRSVEGEHTFKPLGDDTTVTLEQFVRSHPKAIEYSHLVGEEFPAILDTYDEIISLPPILNSSVTEISDQTRDLFIDVTGLNYSVVYKTLMLMMTSLAYNEGSMATVILNGTSSPTIKSTKFDLPIRALKNILGKEMESGLVMDGLKKMGYGIDGDKVIVPNYRFDILHEVDIVEDIIKGIGYENIPMKPEGFVNYGRPNHLRNIENDIRHLLVGYGMNEVVNNILTNGTFNKIYGFDDNAATIQNPLSLEQDHIRTRLGPSLMLSLTTNTRNQYPQRIFEIGTVHRDKKDYEVLGLAISHKEASFSEIKGTIVGIMEDFEIGDYEVAKYDVPMLATGRTASILIKNKIEGYFGEVHPKLLKNLGLKMPVVIGEINITGVFL